MRGPAHKLQACHLRFRVFAFLFGHKVVVSRVVKKRFVVILCGCIIQSLLRGHH